MFSEVLVKEKRFARALGQGWLPPAPYPLSSAPHFHHLHPGTWQHWRERSGPCPSCGTGFLKGKKSRGTAHCYRCPAACVFILTLLVFFFSPNFTGNTCIERDTVFHILENFPWLYRRAREASPVAGRAPYEGKVGPSCGAQDARVCYEEKTMSWSRLGDS